MTQLLQLGHTLSTLELRLDYPEHALLRQVLPYFWETPFHWYDFKDDISDYNISSLLAWEATNKTVPIVKGGWNLQYLKYSLDTRKNPQARMRTMGPSVHL